MDDPCFPPRCRALQVLLCGVALDACRARIMFIEVARVWWLTNEIVRSPCNTDGSIEALCLSSRSVSKWQT